MPSSLKLIVQEFDIPYGSRLPFKGCLYAATPSRNKQKQTSATAWCSELLNLTKQRGKAYYVVPDSFWPQISEERTPDQNPQVDIRLADLIDGVTNGATPYDCIAEIIDHLKDGEDVAILSATKQISGFVPALLGMLAVPDCHIEKILRPIEHGSGYVLTQAQRGYLTGLYDSNRLRELGLGSSIFGDDELSDNKNEQPSSALSEELIAVLEKDFYRARDQLHTFGSELSHEITPELLDITNFLTECEDHPNMDTTLGGMASISYRLCEVFKETGRIGLDALKVVEELDRGFPSHQLKSHLAELRSVHGAIAEQLAHLYDSLICFIQCDISVLEGHPEIANNAPLLKTIKLIDDQLDETFGRIDEIRWAALNISEAIPLDSISLNKGRDWKAMQAMLAECVETCLELAGFETSRWSDKPVAHPKYGESGETVTIKQPTKPSTPDSWHHGRRSAIFVPGGQVPKALNGIAIQAWGDHPRTSDEWNTSSLLMPLLDEPAPPKSSMPLASGVVVVEPDGRIWMVSPTNKFGGYETTFPKGKLDHDGLTMQANAIKEGHEESGLKVRITGYLGDFKRTTSITRLYLAERVGGDPTNMGWESQAVRLVPQDEWANHLQNPSDKPVLAALLKHFGDRE